MPWLVRHAAGTITGEQIGQDGMTAHRRFKGKRFKKEIVKRGECVWHLEPKSKAMHTAGFRWMSGIWLGVREGSKEYVIGIPEGACKVRTVRRKGSEKNRWNLQECNMFRGMPWEPIPERPGIEMTATIDKEKEATEVQERATAEDENVIRRAFRI